jgi:hypothetical protein
MEEVWAVYQRPLDPAHPVICMDETSKQLVSETRLALPAAPGQPRREDYEYERQGVANLFLFCEPLTGWRAVQVTERRTRADWAEAMRTLADQHYATAERITVVLDNLNTHGPASFYEAFAPAEARRLAERFDFHYTPKHGSWLNIAEIELSVLSRQCLDRRIAVQRARNAPRIRCLGRTRGGRANVSLQGRGPVIFPSFLLVCILAHR